MPTVIMSSRAFSTFSLAWFIRLDIWLIKWKTGTIIAVDMHIDLQNKRATGQEFMINDLLKTEAGTPGRKKVWNTGN